MRVKSPAVDDRIVVLATLVSASAAFDRYCTTQSRSPYQWAAVQHLSDKLNFLSDSAAQKKRKEKKIIIIIQNYLKLDEKNPDNPKPKNLQGNCNFTQVKQLLHKVDAQVIWLRTFITLHTCD
jgi:hypothetical protein